MMRKCQTRGRIRKKICHIFGAAAVAGAVLTLGTGTVCGEVYVSEELYGGWDEDEREDSRGEDWGRMTEPGISQAAQERQTGPSINQVTLSEQYHSDYKVYEESLGNQFFFYTSVSNGGITDKDVTMDIPKNIDAAVEKDGEPFPYVRGQTISGYGTYVVRLTAVENPDAPFSEQREYTAFFRFRIQEKPPEESGSEEFSGNFPYGEERNILEGESETEDEFGAAAILQSEAGEATGEGEYGQSGETPDESGEGVGEAALEGDGESLKGDEDSGTEGLDEAGESREHEEGQETESGEAEAGQPGAGQERQPEQQEGGAQGLYSPRIQVYDSASGIYEVTFENGRTLAANVPEGYVGPGAVELSVSEGRVKLYRDDQPVEFTQGQSLTEPGYYRLEADGQPWSFVIASAVRQMDSYPAPAGMAITGAALDGEPRKLSSDRYVSMKEDGLYQIFMTGEDREELEVFLKKDTQAPQVQVAVTGGTADIQYLSDDVETIVLEKNGEVQSGFSGYAIKDPGAYRLTVSDEAGNVSSQEFTVRYRLNIYAVAAIVLILLVAAGVVVFVMHMKKNVKVR